MMNAQILLLLIWTTSAVTYGQDLQQACVIEDSRLTCLNHIPAILPEDITEMYVTNYNSTYLGHQRFVHNSWENVTMLDITANVNISFYVMDRDFVGLEGLKTLGIHARKGSTIQERAFVGLHSLQAIDFSNMIALCPPDLIVPLTFQNVLPNLRKLNLENICTSSNKDTFEINTIFFEMLQAKGISDLCLRGVNILVGPESSNISTAVERLDISNITVLTYRMSHFSMAVTFPNLRYLNISHTFTRFVASVKSTKPVNVFCEGGETGLHALEYVYANSIASKDIYVDQVSVCLNAFPFLKLLHLRDNSLRHLNASFILSNSNSFIEIDLSSNGLRYLGPGVTRDMSKLRNLYLNDNDLFKMSELPEFKQIFRPLVKLETLSLSYNGLTSIPSDMLLFNTKLISVNLRGNFLQSLPNFNYLVSLKLFDLSNNRIAYLKGINLARTKEMFGTRSWRNNSENVEIILEDNPFICSCESVDFIEWLNEYFSHDIYNYTCSYRKETIFVNDQAVSKAKFLCIRTIVYVCSSLGCLLLVLTVVVVAIFTRRRYTKKQRANAVGRFLHKVRNNCLDRSYLCILSYSDKDCEICNKVYGKLKSTLREATNCDRELICKDDLHFRVARPVIDEIIRCVSESYVAIFLVSKSFCESNWCSMELKEALEQQLPVALIFLEEVNPDNMPYHMKKTFLRYTRGKVRVNEEGEVDFHPGGWNGLCDSVISLASTLYADTIRRKKANRAV